MAMDDDRLEPDTHPDVLETTTMHPPGPRAEPVESAAPGRVEHYEVIKRIGVGAMGEVYLARDTKLDRQVALKILPARFTTDERRLERFTREAKSASALNHPNIITIHEIGVAGDLHFIATEFIEGETLRHSIDAGPVEPARAIGIAAQIAAALERAHRSGIVHRDIKPENVMIRPDGLVKVLDFGLAGIRDDDPGADSGEATEATRPDLTLAGTVLGTPQYMAPEQVRGLRARHSADIFALGVVIYEMLAGQLPFPGKTAKEVFSRILEQEPASLPHKLIDPVIRKALAKDPAQRYATIEQFAQALQAAIAPPPPSNSRLALIAAGLVVVALVSVLIIRAPWRNAPPNGSAEARRLTQITNDAGLNIEPAPSPDGRYAAYVSDRGGGQHLNLWLKPLDGGEPVRLTNHAADDHTPELSPDGSRIAFSSSKEGGGIFTIAVVGGEIRRIAPEGMNPTYSPDGSRIAYWVPQGSLGRDAKMYVVPSGGGEPVRLHPDSERARKPAWLADGRIVFFEMTGKKGSYGRGEWWTLRGGEKPRATGLGPAIFAARSPKLDAWTVQQDQIVFADGEGLWGVAVPNPGSSAVPAPHTIVATTGFADHPKADSRGVVFFSSLVNGRDIWSLSLDKAGRPSGGLVHLTDDTAREDSASLSRDGRFVFYESDRSGNREIWMKDLGTGETRRLTSDPTTEHWRPLSDPAGKQLVCQLRKGSGSTLAWLKVSDGIAKEFSKHSTFPMDWCPDGKSVLASSAAGGLVCIATETGKERVVLQKSERELARGRFSPDQKWISLHTRVGSDKRQIFVAAVAADGMLAPESKWIAITDGRTSEFNAEWSSDGNRLYWAAGVSGEDRGRFYCQDLNPQTKHPQGSRSEIFRPARTGEIPIPQFSVSADRIVFPMTTSQGNVWRFGPAIGNRH